MSTQTSRWTLAVALIAGLGLVGVAFGVPQQMQHHGAADQQEGAEAAEMGTCPMAERMMATMHEHMATMQRMMAHMHGEESAGMKGGHGMMAGSGDDAPGMEGHGMMAGMMHGGMMHGMMADPASIDDAEVAASRADRLESMVERMRSHLGMLEERAAAFRERAEELRQES